MLPSDMVPQEVLKDIANSFTVNNRMELLRQVEATAELCQEFKTTNQAAAMQLAKELEEAEALVQGIQSQLNSIDYEPVREASREVARFSNSLQPAVAPEVEKFAADMSRLSAQMAGVAAQSDLIALQNTIASQQEEILSSLLKVTAPSEDVIPADERLNRGPPSSNFPHGEYRDFLQTPIAPDLSQRLDLVVDYLVQYYDPISREDAVSFVFASLVGMTVRWGVSATTENPFVAGFSALLAGHLALNAVDLTGTTNSMALDPDEIDNTTDFDEE